MPSRTQVASAQSYTKTDTIRSVPSLWPCHLSLLPLQVHRASPNSSQRQMHNLASASPADFCLPHFSHDAPVVGRGACYLSHSDSVLSPAPHRTCRAPSSPYVLRYSIWLMDMSLLVLTQARSQHREVAWVSQDLTGPHKVVSEQGSLYNSSACPFHP